MAMVPQHTVQSFWHMIIDDVDIKEHKSTPFVWNKSRVKKTSHVVQRIPHIAKKLRQSVQKTRRALKKTSSLFHPKMSVSILRCVLYSLLKSDILKSDKSDIRQTDSENAFPHLGDVLEAIDT